MAIKRKRISRYSKVQVNGYEYYKTDIEDAEGKRVILYATILASEDRTKELRQPRPSVREHLKQEPKQVAPTAPAHKKREPER